jgi:DNA-binding NtrC family response regulator
VDALPLRGRSILVVEDEPLIAMDLERALRDAGANVISACTLAHALQLVNRAGLSVAVLDYRLADADCTLISNRLQERRIPFVIYSGWCDIRTVFPNAAVVLKPAVLNDLVAAVSDALHSIEPVLALPSTRVREYALGQAR